MYADDVDVVNPIGHAIGHHKLTFVYLVLLNRRAENRMHIANINLATVILSKDLDEFSPEVAISGHVGESATSTSIGAAMRRFETGQILQVSPCLAAFLFVFLCVCFFVCVGSSDRCPDCVPRHGPRCLG
jgi:hypothetical protein